MTGAATPSNAQLRQSELFAGENWNVVYKAFTAVNLQSYDFDTIRQAMVTYIQTNYPENFQDWIANSEFVMIIDLIAYLGQSLAFRVDLNSRENFMDTAERRESILKLAMMLNYSPKRNFPARGILKLTEIQTDQTVVDSDGTNLTNIPISWNDPTNQNWLEQFILILNSALQTTNPFGLPIQQQLISNVTSQLYQLNSAPLTTVSDPFQVTVNGQGTAFELVNPTFDPLGFFSENNPNPLAGKNIIYRNDGAGNASPNTGFFGYFKQGNLQWSDFQFDFPLENRVIDINVNNINQLDVWVEEINDAGLVVATWTPVPTTDNIAFTSVDNQNRTIYSVITRDNDQISIRFGDGRFGQAPTGLFRVWYRVSNGLQYQINSSDMDNVQISIPYLVSNNNTTQQQNLTLTYSLQYGISTQDVGASIPRETSDQIKQRASQVYYTQNRMVNGEDYNIFPLQYGNVARKVKAVNRTYSGQSRYIDINDPTGRYQNTNLFSDDGILYRDLFNRSTFESLPTTKTALEMISNDIQPLLNETDLRDFFLAYYPRFGLNNTPYPTIWHQANGNGFGTTGEFKSNTGPGLQPQPIGPGAIANYFYLTEGALVKFTNPLNANDYIWSAIEQVTGAGVDPLMDTTGVGPVVLSTAVNDGWYATLVVPSFRQVLVSSEVSNIEDVINSKVTFALRYNYTDTNWQIVTASNIDFDSSFSLLHAGDQSNSNLDASWLMLAEYLPSQGYWQFMTRNLRYIFESVLDARFFFVDSFKVVDVQRNLPLQDFIKILKYNTLAAPSSAPLGVAYEFDLLAPIVYPDGYIEPRRVQVTFTDNNSTGIPDNPDIFDIIVDPTGSLDGGQLNERYVYHTLVTDGDYQYWVPVDGSPGTSFTPTAPIGTIITFDVFSGITTTNLPAGYTAYAIDQNKFWLRNTDLSLTDVSSNYQANIGRDDLNFQWKHYVPQDQRIDPSNSNIIDIYVLTQNYYQAVQTWLTSLNQPAFPTSPTTDELRQQFEPLEDSKMISDEIIWHSAEFKLLFGQGANQELQAQFMCIPVSGTTVTNNEIQQMVINAVNQFFNVDNWSFGETFYYTELAAYIHQQLATVLASIVIVPNLASSKFGNLFVVRAAPTELFLSTATVSDVLIVDNYTNANIRIGN